jgi:hypothetical protein
LADVSLKAAIAYAAVIARERMIPLQASPERDVQA